MSKYGDFSGPYFPAFGPDKTPYLDTFHAVNISPNHRIKHENQKLDAFGEVSGITQNETVIQTKL